MRKKLSRFLTLFFVLLSLLHVVALYAGNMTLQMMTKPLIIPCLIAIYLLSSNSRNKTYLAALFFSFVGDILLMDKENLFLYGIASFLITQILYVYLFSKGIEKSGWSLLAKSVLPFGIYYVILIKILWPGLGDFLLPVLVYGFVISLFGSAGLMQYLKKPDRHHLTLLAGAVLFIASDSMIALNKFQDFRTYYPLAIMITYILAQYLILQYVLESESGERLQDSSTAI